MNILVFAGTKNGRELITELLNYDVFVIASSMSDHGASLLPKHENLVSLIGKKSSLDIETLIDKNCVDLVIDSTHPYAKEISTNIVNACKNSNSDLVRLERKGSIPKELGMHFDNMADVNNYLNSSKGNVFFTTGVNELPNICSILELDRIYARVLNVKSSIDIITNCKLPKNQAVIKNPPYTLEENIKHLIDNNITYLVTKDSGQDGNVTEKIEAVKQTGISLIVIDRPKIEYKKVMYKNSEILEYIGVI